MRELLEKLGVGKYLTPYRPIDGSVLSEVIQADPRDYEKVVETASNAFREWRMVPAPRRGETVRQIGVRLMEGLHASSGYYHQLVGGNAFRTGDKVRYGLAYSVPIRTFPKTSSRLGGGFTSRRA